MLIQDQHPLNKSIVVSVLGSPNAGKSSLINALLGFDLSIVTSKPQTTRNTFHCVVTIDRTEIVFVDTPGIHSSSKELNRRMNGQAVDALEGSDLNLLLVDLSTDVLADIRAIKATIGEELSKTWIVGTKSDLAPGEALAIAARLPQIQELIPSVERIFALSSKTGENVHLLTGALCDSAPNSPHLYPRGDVSNKNERFFATEYIREELFEILRDEVPYEVAVVIEDYRENFEETEDGEKRSAVISAAILVNRPSQRAIVVGRGGQNIKTIGMNARRKIQALIDGHVRLNLHVKVAPDWMKNNYVLEQIGLPRVKDSTRVWRKK